MTETREQQRLAEAREQAVPWKRWGPYHSERQWGTVREDCSADGNAWDYFSHDQALSRAYRWGEFQTDPHWRDCILFYEYFHGDIGAGLGASHQTGWTRLVARLIQMYRVLEPRALLDEGKRGFHAAAAPTR
jgi:hypothetical protein